MSQQIRSGNKQGIAAKAPARRPLAHWIAAALAVGAMQAAHAGTPPVLSSAWLAQRQNLPANAAGAPSSGVNIPGLGAQTSGQLLQQKVVQQSIANLNNAAQAVAAQMAAQQQAAQKAQQLAGSPVPNGLTPGGLQVAANGTWQNVNAPTQSAANGQITVDVKQTAQKAIATWGSFNVGRQTTVHFDQTGGTQSSGANDWIVLNRIVDPSGVPSQIFGQIKAEGSVYLINRNGILFGAGSQVNTRSFLASSLDLFSSDVSKSNQFFLQEGLAQTTDPSNILGQGTGSSPIDGFLVNGTDATGATTGAITIQPGASITTGVQGFALIAAPNINNAGSIVDDQGQVFLAASSQVGYVAPAANGNGLFTINGGNVGSGGLASQGQIVNTGLVQARTGNVQWFGADLEQNGVVLASTSLTQPGDISFDSYQLSAQAGGAIIAGQGKVELGQGSVTTILPEKNGETTSSSATADAAFHTGSISLSGNTVTLNSDALIEAPGADVTLTAALGRNGPGRVYIDDGAIIDVSGLADIELPMSALLVTIPRIGQNELANSPLLRNSFLYTQQNVVVDSSQGGTLPDGLSWVGSPILNAAGYVQNIPRAVDQLLVTGGNITLAGGEVIARTGSQLLLNGGYLAYQPGWVSTPNLLGANGRIYNIAGADPDVAYVGFAGQYTMDHSRWGVSETWGNPLLAGSSHYDSGFVVGYDAGTLTIEPSLSTVQPVLDGAISAQAFTGRNQAQQGNNPKGGSLVVSNIDLAQASDITRNTSGIVNFIISNQPVPLEDSQANFESDTPLADSDGNGGSPSDPSDPYYWRTLSAAMLDNAGFSSISLQSGGTILVDGDTTLKVQPGGSIKLSAAKVDVEGTLQARSGNLDLNAFANIGISGEVPLTSAGIVVGAAGLLDASGLFVNDSGLLADQITGSAFTNGGSITLSAWKGGYAASADFTGDIDLQSGSVLNVSGGGYVGSDGQVSLQSDVPIGKGGNISIGTHEDGGPTNYINALGSQISAPPNLLGGQIILDGTLLGYGFSGGGTLSLHAPQIQIGGTADPSADASLLYLSPSFFQGQGFSSYKLTADTDAAIAPGTMVQVQPSFLLPNYQALASAPTGTDLYAVDAAQPAGRYATIGALDAYHRWLLDGASAGFSLSAGGYLAWNTVGASGLPPAYAGVTGSLELGQGAAIQVDPGAAVSLTAANQLTVLGAISAPGGAITLSNLTVRTNGQAVADSIWLGSGSVLNAAGTVLTNPWAASVVGVHGQAFQPTTGTVLDGGSISLSSNGYLLAQPGALLDVSGTQSVFDLPQPIQRLGASASAYVSTPVWSDAGNILLAASGGMLFDASLQGQAGAPQAEGGSLTIAGLTPTGAASRAGIVPRAIVLQASGDFLPTDLAPGDSVEPGLAKPSGILRFAVARLDGSGITSLAIGPAVGDGTSENTYSVVPLLFSGNVDLALGRSFVADASAYAALPAGATALSGPAVSGAGVVSISAPYVYLAGTPTGTTTPVPVIGDGSFSVQAGFLDLGGQVLLQGFAQANFASAGDLRFYLPALDVYGSGTQPKTGWLYSTGDLAFSASRIYPVSDYSFLIDADPQNGGTTTVSFNGNGVIDNTTPLSAGGTLAVAATRINQGGMLWVPSGDITLGVTDPASELSSLSLAANFPLQTTQSVQLLPGSFTSVSLGGAIVPYGSTVDGTDWRYDASPSSSSVAPDLSAPPAKQVSIEANQIMLSSGATIDLSGGGDLQSEEWVPGTGGTRDVLSQYETTYANGSGTATQTPQYADGRAIYAILPGYTAPVGAYDAALAKGSGAGPAVGQAVYLSGVPGLPAGVYTLLPSKYATLPGAYRVVQDTRATDSVLGHNATLPDGTQAVTGYFTDALDGTRASHNTTFLVQSGPVWQQYSQYTLGEASSYFADQAQHGDTIPPPLPTDAGHLRLGALTSLTLDTTLAAAAAPGGRGAEVDIAGQAIQIVSPGVAGLDGYLHVDADGLTDLGAASLLIGGTRTSSDAGDVLDATAGSVVLSNDTAHPLSGPEVILATNGQGSGIDLQSGSVLSAIGSLGDAGAVPLLIGSAGGSGTTAISGDGALVRVANGPVGAIERSDITGIDGPTGVAGGDLTIAAGAVLDGGLALSLDATGNTRVDPEALFSAQNIDIAANRISFVDDTRGEENLQGLLIGPNTLAQFAGADSVLLRSRSSIDFLGNVQASLGQSLTLDAAALTSDGGSADLTAGTLVLTNDQGSAAATFAAGDGQLAIHAGELDFGSGPVTLQGFGGVSAQTSQDIAAQGSGNFDFGSLDVSLNAPVVLADTGADVSIVTTGALNLGSAAGSALSRQALGGRLTLTGGSLAVGTTVSAPGGTLTLDASTGDLMVDAGARLSVAGAAKDFNDTQAYVPGGTLTLAAGTGNIQVDAAATLDLAGAVGGGNAGRLVVQAAQGSAQLQGQVLGNAADGYLGGNLFLQTGGGLDLDGLADILASGGVNGTILIQTGAGNLVLDAGHALTAHGVTLVADGGTGGAGGGQVRIDGTVDASGTFSSPISLYGKGGVDIEGSLLSNATAADQSGGDITLGTSGTGDGTFNAAYGYENVQVAGSGTIHIGAGAKFDLGGPRGNGTLSLRAPLLADGDVNVNIDSGATIIGVANLSLEAYATWSTADIANASNDLSKYFDGLVDPAGWYGYANGQAQLVSGTWTDGDGNAIAAPDPSNSAQMAQYLAEYYFTPSSSAVNGAHQSFYGYLNGDPGQGPGTLMGFVEAPGFNFGTRFAGLANFHVQPGIELVNPNSDVNDGNIGVLTNWNLGAGTSNPDGTVQLAYRYGDQAPVLSLLASNNLVVQASITDGFYQAGSVIAPPGPPLADYAQASAAYQSVLDRITLVVGSPDPTDGGLYPDGIVTKPFDLPSSAGSEQEIEQYYGQYTQYTQFLTSPFPGAPILVGTFGAPIDAIMWVYGFGAPFTASFPGQPAPIAPPTVLGQYPAYLTNYQQYFAGSIAAAGGPDWLINQELDTTFQFPSAPPTNLDLIPNASPTVDNSPSPVHAVDNPLPLLSATLVAGNSSSYRLVAGADIGSANPLAVQAAAVVGNAGNLSLDGHTDYLDQATGRVLYSPTLIRTGSGDINMAAAGDIEWLDTTAPAAVYAAGTPAPGTTADATANILQVPSTATNFLSPELVVTGAVNPIGGGNVSLSAGGDINGIQQVTDADGSATGAAGTPIGQYWWQWMQTGNSADGSRSSINFGAFDQGVMSIGGNVDVAAGGDIRNLSVSLPTTWYANANRTAVTTVGGGNLNVRAGGDILSGSYFVAQGQGTISAGGNIGSDWNYTATVSNQGVQTSVTTPVATLLAMQDANLQVQAGGSVNIGGIYNPSWLDSSALDSFMLPAGHADGQSYSTDSSLSVLAAGGTLTYGSLSIPLSLFVPGGVNSGGTAGNVLPATVDFVAPGGDIDILAGGELYPSAQGNLNLLADGSISFVDAENRQQSQSQSWGLIDAPATLLPSPLNTVELTGISGYVSSLRKEGYINPGNSGASTYAQYLHQSPPLHGDDTTPVRIYALSGSIVDGIGVGAGAGNLLIAPTKPALVQAGLDIVDLAFLGQQTHASDVTLISAGRDIYDTPLVLSPLFGSSPPDIVAVGQGILPVILEGGPGNLIVQAGRDIGSLSNQTALSQLASSNGLTNSNDAPLSLSGSSQALTGINTVGNAFNPFLPKDGANIQVSYGVGPGVDQAAFIADYIDPSTGVAGVPSLTPELVAFMESYQEGRAVDTGYAADQISVTLTPEQAWSEFQTLPSYVQRLFVSKALFTILSEVGEDYNAPASPYYHQYARGYAAIDTLFPASLGYTDNGGGEGGINGAQRTVDTGDLDIRGSTIQTQQGGDIDILAPGGQALVGSTSAPPLITTSSGQVLAGPNALGILTLEQGDVNIFTDRSVLLAQSRIFTEQGGNMAIWSSNGDINAGQGAKTTTELATADYLCTIDAFCQLDPSGSVSGAGIATLQTIPGAPAGNVYLMAPRGTVDAGDAGIRVSGNIVIAAARVLNADNIQVQGTKIGVPVVQSVNVSALTAASAAASAVSKVADDMARQQQSDARSNMPSIISVQVLGFGGGDSGASVQGEHQSPAYDAASPVQVLGAGHLGGKRKAALTVAEQQQLTE